MVFKNLHGKENSADLKGTVQFRRQAGFNCILTKKHFLCISFLLTTAVYLYMSRLLTKSTK